MSTILVVDDQPELRQMYRTVLARAGYDVCVAANGNEALLAMEMCFPDLILLDLAMPEMDGITFLRLIRNTPEWAKVPVIVLTAFVNEDQAQTARLLGATAHLVKAEFTVKELRNRVARCLEPDCPAVAGAARVASASASA